MTVYVAQSMTEFGYSIRGIVARKEDAHRLIDALKAAPTRRYPAPDWSVERHIVHEQFLPGKFRDLDPFPEEIT